MAQTPRDNGAFNEHEQLIPAVYGTVGLAEQAPAQPRDESLTALLSARLHSASLSSCPYSARIVS